MVEATGFLERQKTHQAAARTRRRQLAAKQYEGWTHTPKLTARRGTPRGSNRTQPAASSQPTKLKCTTSTVAHTLGTLRTCHVTSLDMSGCGIGEAGAARLAKSLRTGSSIATLNLAANSLSSKAVAEVVQGLHGQLVRGAASVTSLNLSGNTLATLSASESAAVAALAGLLRRGDCILQKLNLASTGLQPPQVCALSKALQLNSSLKAIELRGNKPQTSGCRALGEACASSPSLTSLQLSACQIGDEGVQQLLCALPGRGVLAQLNLGSNGLTDKATVDISRSLSRPGSCIKALGLSDNSISSRGVGAVAKLISTSPLSDLQLSDNDIGDAGAVALSTVLDQLDRLKLAGCGVLDSGALAIAQAAASSSSAVQILLSRNRLGPRARKALQDVCDRRSWSWSKERVLWCGYHAATCSGLGGMPVEVMTRLVALCRGSRGALGVHVPSFPITVDFGDVVSVPCALGIHRSGDCKCAPPKPDFYE